MVQAVGTAMAQVDVVPIPERPTALTAGENVPSLLSVGRPAIDELAHDPQPDKLGEAHHQVWDYSRPAFAARVPE